MLDGGLWAMLDEYQIADLKGSVGGKNQPHMTLVQFREYILHIGLEPSLVEHFSLKDGTVRFY